MSNIIPLTIRMQTQLGVIITAVSSYLFSDEMGDFWRFSKCFQFHFRHHQRGVFTMEFVHFKGMFTTLHEPAGFVDDSRFTECHQLPCILYRNLVLKFRARKAAIETRALDSQEGLIITNPDTHRPAALASDIALLDMVTSNSLVLVRIVKHEEFAFNFLSHKP